MKCVILKPIGVVVKARAKDYFCCCLVGQGRVDKLVLLDVEV